MSKKASAILSALTADTSYNAENKAAFHRIAKAQLKQVAKLLGADYGEIDPIRSNQGGIAVSGEITLHADNLYIQVEQSCFMRGSDILVRSCTSRKDYTGGANKFLSLASLVDPEYFVSRVKQLVPVPG